MAWPDFLALLDSLLAAGCRFADDLGAEPRDGAVVLTFDDATADHRALGEALAERGVPAIFFVPAGLLGTPGHVEAAAIRELAARGHVIGSHGWSHRRLDRLAESDLSREIDGSRARLEDLTGTPVTLFAPAGGIGIPTLPERLRAAGYVASRSTRWGIHRRAAERWSIPAVTVTRFTADRGWVTAAATQRRLPPQMLAVRAIRDMLGPDIRTVVRGLLHRRHDGAAASPGAGS
jgi:peptidoglycan/xylan/chitin deacetylase (PgdA/CDA1 family)